MPKSLTILTNSCKNDTSNLIAPSSSIATVSQNIFFIVPGDNRPGREGSIINLPINLSSTNSKVLIKGIIPVFSMYRYASGDVPDFQNGSFAIQINIYRNDTDTTPIYSTTKTILFLTTLKSKFIPQVITCIPIYFLDDTPTPTDSSGLCNYYFKGRFISYDKFNLSYEYGMYLQSGFKLLAQEVS